MVRGVPSNLVFRDTSLRPTELKVLCDNPPKKQWPWEALGKAAGKSDAAEIREKEVPNSGLVLFLSGSEAGSTELSAARAGFFPA